MFVALMALLPLSAEAKAFNVERCEPLCWWEGMATDLQIMLYGENLRGSSVTVDCEGLEVLRVHEADSPNYLFVDVDVKKAGKYVLSVEKNGKTAKVDYDILPRCQGSSDRQGLTPADAIYLIVPDRFANGDAGNDLVEVKGTVQELDRSKMDVRHGGDIQGIIDHLDYIADLGVTTIWPTPMLEDNQFYHHYAISDYYRIDPHFGTNELYCEFVRKAHSKGLKVIQDVVPNHCGSGHWWMADLPFSDWVNERKLSSTPGSFALPPMSDIHASTADKKLQGKSWLYDCMPDMNLDNPFVLQYLTQMAIWWVEYANLDALRVDTYFYMGLAGSKWTANIRKEYPRMRFVGEVWNDNPAFLSFWVGDYKKYNGFASNLPMVMDFPLQRSIVTGLTNDFEMWGGTTKAIYNVIAQDFLYRNPYRELVTFVDNHDIDRMYDMLGRNLEKAKTAMTLLMTLRGTPQILYGTELLFENDSRGGAHKNRPDFPGGWPSDSLNLFDASSRTPAQNEMFRHIQALLDFRKEHAVACYGKLKHFVPEGDVYVYFRYDGDGCVMVVVNGNDNDADVDWNRFGECLDKKNYGVELFSGKRITKGSPLKIGGNKSMVIYFE